MTKPASLLDIPNALASSSVNGLRRLMFLNNKKTGNFHNYQIVWNDTDRKWYAWYIDQSVSRQVPMNKSEVKND